MDLSIIIVSYNVLPFLRQCIQSIAASTEGLAYEMIIVDNHSKDGSDAFLSGIGDDRIRYVLNDDNVGYGKAMNQGMALARGEYILLLNPDTIITQASIHACINRLRSDPKCGSVGVRMMDGKGQFLRESKRGYPTIASSFYKMIGLNRLFPKSESIARYHLGHLDENANHRVDILTGAFLMTRKSLMDRLGGFDERYFMYGEDIDLCHSIVSEGFYNYYIGETSIIHFKGESTKRASIRSTFHFYNSMLLFVKKHHAQNRLYIGLLGIAIFLAGVFEWIKTNFLPKLKQFLRWSVYVGLFYAISKSWGVWNFSALTYFDYDRHYLLIGAYASLLTLGYYVGTPRKFIRNQLLAIGVILILYSLLPLSWRSSRAVILLGGGIIILCEIFWAMKQAISESRTWKFWESERMAILLGDYNKCERVISQLAFQNNVSYRGIVSDQIYNHPASLSDFEHLSGYLENHKIDVLTMHMESMSMDQIMTIISKLGSQYQYLLYSERTNSIIDSPDSQVPGVTSLIEVSWAIDKSEHRIMKRVTDFGFSVTFLLFSPILIWFIEERAQCLNNVVDSLLGRITWVGYNATDSRLHTLPRIKPYVIEISRNNANAHSDNVAYARDYSFTRDIMMIFNRFASLGDKVEIHAEN